MSEVKDNKTTYNNTPYSCYQGVADRMTLEGFSKHMKRWHDEFKPELIRESVRCKPTPSTWTTVYVHNDHRTLTTREDFEMSAGFDPNDYEYLQSFTE